MAACCSVRRLILAARIGIQAALQGGEIREELQRDEMDKGREPFVDFRDNQDALGGNIMVRGRNDYRRAKHFQFSGGAKNLTCTVVCLAPCENTDDRAARIDLGKRPVQNFFSFEAFRGDVAGLFDFESRFASGRPAHSGAENSDTRKRGDLFGQFAHLGFECKRLTH